MLSGQLLPPRPLPGSRRGAESSAAAARCRGVARSLRSRARAHAAQTGTNTEAELLSEPLLLEQGAQHTARSRRRCFLTAGAAVVATAWPLLLGAAPSRAASAASAAWEALGIGQADLYFPEQFLGEWLVTSVAQSVETPLGDELAPDAASLARARAEVGTAQQYRQRFVRNAAGRVVLDRAFNTLQLAAATAGPGAVVAADWDVEDPNILRLRLRGGASAFVRVTRRVQERPGGAEDRLETSELIEQVLESGGGVDVDDVGNVTGGGASTRLRASRCGMKWKWRSPEAAAGGPEIVASQVVLDYLNSMDDFQAQAEARGRPSVVRSYRLAFVRAPAAELPPAQAQAPPSSAGAGSSS